MEEVKRESPVVLAVALALPTLCRDPSKALCVTLTLRTSFHYDRRARGPFLRNFGYNGAVSDEGTGPSWAAHTAWDDRVFETKFKETVQYVLEVED